MIWRHLLTRKVLSCYKVKTKFLSYVKVCAETGRLKNHVIRKKFGIICDNHRTEVYKSSNRFYKQILKEEGLPKRLSNYKPEARKIIGRPNKRCVVDKERNK